MHLRTPLTQTLISAIPNLYPDDPPPASSAGVTVPDLPAPPADLPSGEATTGGDTGSSTVGGADSQDSVSGDTGEDSISGGEGNDSVSGATVPDVYEIKVKDSDGKDIDLDADLLTAATPIFKAAGLSNENAQQIAQFYAANVLPGVSNFVQQQTLELLGIADMGEWAAKLKADKDIGGAKYAENLTIIAQGRDAFASTELKALLETTRLGNHPEVNRLFFKLGKQVAEGKVHTGDPTPKPAGGAESFYDASFSPKS